MKQQLPILETNPATLSVAFGPKTSGTMTVFKEDETTALVDGVDFNAAGSDLTPNGQGLIEIDMLITQVVTVKDGSTIVYKAIIEGDNGRIEEMADGRIVIGFNFKLNSAKDEIQVLANGSDGAFAHVYFANNQRSHAYFVIYGSVTASTRMDITLYEELPLSKKELNDGKQVFGFNIKFDVAANEVQIDETGPAWAWVFDTVNGGIVRYERDATAGDQINLVAFRIDYEVQFVLGDGRIAKGYNIVLDGASSDEIDSKEDGSAFVQIHDKTANTLIMYNLPSTATAGDRVDVTPILTISDKNVIVGNSVTGYSAVPDANDKRFEINNPIDNGNAQLGLNIRTDAGDPLIGSGLHISVSEAFDIGLFSVARSSGNVLPISFGTIANNIKFDDATNTATITNDIVNVTRTFTTVALANADGLPLGTRYKLSVGTDDVKSQVRETF